MEGFSCNTCFDHTDPDYPPGQECPDCPPECPACAPRALPEEVEEFRAKLASPEWQDLVARAREHVGFHAPSESAYKAFRDAIDYSAEQILAAEFAAVADFDPTSAEPLWRYRPSYALYFLFQVALAAATLATYLETRTIGALIAFLLGDVPVDPERLQPAGPRATALEGFTRAFFELIGVPRRRILLPLSTRDAALVMFVGTIKWKHPPLQERPKWDRMRVLWNRDQPRWSYDDAESFRKACERALTAYEKATDDQSAPDAD